MEYMFLPSLDLPFFPFSWGMWSWPQKAAKLFGGSVCIEKSVFSHGLSINHGKNQLLLYLAFFKNIFWFILFSSLLGFPSYGLKGVEHGDVVSSASGL